MPSGFIYWCDFSSRTPSQNAIRKIKPDGSYFRNVITNGIGLNGIRGIAIDWVAGQYYCCLTNLFLILIFQKHLCQESNNMKNNYSDPLKQRWETYSLRVKWSLAKVSVWPMRLFRPNCVLPTCQSCPAVVGTNKDPAYRGEGGGEPETQWFLFL